MLRDNLDAFRQVFKQPCADVGDGFQLPRAAVAFDELAGQRTGLEPEHDLMRGLRDFREGAEREDDRRGRNGDFGLTGRALADGNLLRHAVVLYADFRGVHEIAADLDERVEIVRGDKAGLEIGDKLVGRGPASETVGGDDGLSPHVRVALLPAPKGDGHYLYSRYIVDVDKELSEIQPVGVLVEIVYNGLQGAHGEMVLFSVIEAFPLPFRVRLVEAQPVFCDMHRKRGLGLAVKGFEFPTYADEMLVSFEAVDFHVILLWLLVDGMFLSLLERGYVHGHAAVPPEFRGHGAFKAVLVGTVVGE